MRDHQGGKERRREADRAVMNPGGAMAMRAWEKGKEKWWWCGERRQRRGPEIGRAHV